MLYLQAYYTTILSYPYPLCRLILLPVWVDTSPIKIRVLQYVVIWITPAINNEKATLSATDPKYSSLNKLSASERKRTSAQLVEMDQATVNGGKDPKPHIVLVPLLAPGHMIPMVDMGRLLAAGGATVTVVITPLNAARIKPTIDSISRSNLPIHFLSLRFPCAEAGLPDGCENGDMLPSVDLAKNFFIASSMLLTPLLHHLRSHTQPPSCIIADACQPWTHNLAAEFHIPMLVFHGMGCFALLCSHNIHLHGILEDSNYTKNKPFIVPGLPHKIQITREQAPGFFNSAEMVELAAETKEAEEKADGVVVNSYDELEPGYADYYRRLTGKRLWTVGPTWEVADVIVRGNVSSINEHQCLSWLDSKEPGSVVYVSFGSMVSTAPAQLVEIGLGLEMSNRPFIWVIKAGDRSPEVEKWLSSDGFEARTKERGLVINGWAPQVMILSHPAVGGFVTHCGWNSTLESVVAGVPMATWPHFADQFLNERLVVEVLGIGVEVGVSGPTTWAEEHSEAVVAREGVERTVNKLMDRGEEGARRRQRAGELARKAKEARGEGGSSHANLIKLFEFISCSADNKNKR